jgi:phage shock protein PspC (stress-responsive transcriptional regulator)/heme/copper-type cytochrome/quinol oxidase subunit 2
MKKVININFQGRVVPIEESAYDILKQYVESLRRFFAKEEGCDEIINDIEGRIAELFGETLKKGVTCIRDEDVNSIIASMGRPEDFDGEEASVKSQLGSDKQEQNNTSSNTSSSTNYQQQANTNDGGPKRLYRDETDKVLGGVSSGIARYLGIDPIIVRVLFVICTFGFGFGFITYLILWVAVPGTSSAVIGSQRKRLFRDNDDKVIAGVCSGLAQYFNVSVWIPRLLFLIPFFSFVFNFGHWHFGHFPDFFRISFSPGAAFVYIILWLVLPEAKTAADKLEMKGEKVDLNNIKNTIQSDLEGFGNRAKKWGEDLGKKAESFGADVSQKAQEFGGVAAERGKQFGAEASNVARRHSSGLGHVLMMIVKIFLYFILGCILFAIVCALFSIGVAALGLVPAWSYVINDGWQTILAWGTLVLFIWVPVIGIVTYIIRRLTGKRGNSNAVRYAFGGLWTIGWFCVIGLIASLSSQFRSKNNASPETVALADAKVKRLEIKLNKANYDEEENWLKLSPFASFSDDTVFVRNIKVRIVKSPSDSFQVSLTKYSRGKDKQYANELASKINYTVTQTDSVLNLAKGIAINQKDKFRNQHVIVTIAVPVGKKFILTGREYWRNSIRVDFGSDDYEWNMYGWDNGDRTINLSYNVEYVMGDKKVERTSRLKNRDNEDDNNDNEAPLNNYKQSKEELERTVNDEQQKLNEQQKRLDEKKKELLKPVDSTRYKYTPEKPKQKEVKPTAKLNTSISMSDLLLMKLSI